MSIDTIIVNGKKLPWLMIGRGFKIPSFNYTIETETVPGRDGQIFKNRRIESYDFEIPLIARNDDYLNAGDKRTHDDMLNEIVKFLNYDEPVSLKFESQTWHWKAMFEGPLEIDKRPFSHVEFTIKVKVLDPFKYSDETFFNSAISDQISIVNTGTADTPVIIEARALKDSPNFMIAKGVDGEAIDYFMVGQSEDAYKELKDISPYRFNDEFNSLDLKNWAYMPNDTTFGTGRDGGDARGGRFAVHSNKESIYPSNWGTASTTNWHGAAIYKSVGTSLQDFKIRFKVVIRQYAGVGTGKSFAYIRDENGRIMFSIGYVNTTMNKDDSEIAAYAYNEHGEARKIYSRATPYKLKKAKNLHVFMHFERKGQDIKITTCKYNTDNDKDRKKPLDNDVKVIKDKGNFYQRKARVMNIYTGKSSKYSKFLGIHVLGFSVQELLPKQNDITPIIIRKGDLVRIDTKEHIVTINDDNALHLKDFGSNYFNVPRGISELIISPEGTFDTTVKWTERYI